MPYDFSEWNKKVEKNFFTEVCLCKENSFGIFRSLHSVVAKLGKKNEIFFLSKLQCFVFNL